VRVVDVDGDGLTDVVTRNGSSPPPVLRILHGRADGTLAPPVDTPLAGDPTRLVVGDVNGDGLRDLVLPSGLGVAIALADGAGSFSVSTVDVFPPPDPSHLIGYGYIDHVAVGDLDGDGLPEIVGTPRPNSGNPPEYRDDLVTLQDLVVIRWTPSGFALVPQTHTTWGGISPRSVDVVDMDGDGHLDVVVGTWVDVRVILGDGTDDLGARPPPAVYPAGNAGWELEVGDVNGNGRPDLVGWNGTIAVWLNAGQKLVPVATPPLSEPNAGRGMIALADVDLDGALDVGLAWESWTHDAGAIQLFHGRGDGTFAPFPPAGVPEDASSPLTVPLPSGRPYAFALGDVTGDARPDVIVTTAGAHDLGHAVYVLVRRTGAFAQGEVQIRRPLRKVHVPGAQINDIRIAREAGA
jgi:hypothetical protein